MAANMANSNAAHTFFMLLSHAPSEPSAVSRAAALVATAGVVVVSLAASARRGVSVALVAASAAGFYVAKTLVTVLFCIIVYPDVACLPCGHETC